jgi:hypothetical protein
VGAFATFFVVGLAPWLLVNGLWSEVPILISKTPEGLTMPSWLTVVMQFGNLFSILYSFLIQRRVPNKYAFLPIIIVLSIAPIVGMSIGLFWHKTTTVKGVMYSLALSSLGAFTGLIGALLTVTLYPWASQYGATMVAAVSTGSGANGLLTAVLAVAQNPTSPEPHFAFSTYFFVLSSILFLSIVCFIVVQLVPFFDQWRTASIATSIINDKHSLFAVPQKDDDDYLTPQLTDSFKKNYTSTQFKSVNGVSGDFSSATSGSESSSTHEHLYAEDFAESERHHLLAEDDHVIDTFYKSNPSQTEIPTSSLLWIIRAPIMYQLFINLLYYLLLGLIPFAFGHHEHSNRFTFWTNIIGMASGAIGRLITFKWRFYFPRTFTIIQVPFFAFVFILCFFQNHKLPEAVYYIAVISFTLFSGLFGYADTINFQLPLVLLEGFEGEIQRASRWVAVANQLGSLFGAMIGFSLTMTVLKS